MKLSRGSPIAHSVASLKNSFLIHRSVWIHTHFHTVHSFFQAKNELHSPFCVRENGVLRPLSDRDSAQGKAYVTKVGHGYSHGSQPFCTVGSFIRTWDKVIEQ